MDKIKIQIRKGTLEYIILLVLYEKEYYWRDILKVLKNHNLDIVEWTLYPILNRLEKEQFIEYTLKVSPLWPKRKYYEITAKWKDSIKLIKESYDELNTIIKTLLSKIKLW